MKEEQREIKFRCWDKKRKLMTPASRLDFPLQEKNFIILQFTGLKDKNGKEIYEGDIIRILYTDWGSQHLGTKEQKKMSFEDYKKSISKIGVVVFREDRFCLEFNGRFGKEIDSIFEGTHGEKEVIGNIYENPELI